VRSAEQAVTSTDAALAELCLECLAQDLEGVVVVSIAKAADALCGERGQLEQGKQLLDAVVDVAHD
jgi:hypothetical protein